MNQSDQLFDSMFEMYQSKQNEFGYFNIAKLINESARNFNMASQCFVQILQKNSNVPANLKNQLLISLQFLTQLTESSAALKLVIFYESQVEDEPSKGHFGLALSYLMKAEKICKIMNPKLVNGFINARLLKRCEENQKYCQTNFSIYMQRNQQIYKNKTFEDQNLPIIPSIQEDIKLTHSAQPEKLLEPLEEQKMLSQFGDAFRQTTVKLQTDHKANYEKVADQIQAFLEQKGQKYKESFVNYCLEMNSSKSYGQKDQLLEKLKQFQQKGGFHQLEQYISQANGLSQNCQTLLQNVHRNILNEEKDDQMMKSQYGHYWNRTPSVSLNSEFKQQIHNLQEKYNIAQTIDHNIIQKFQSNQTLLKQTSIAQQDLAGLQNVDDSKGNQDLQLQNLKQSHQQIQFSQLLLIITNIETASQIWKDHLGKLNYSQEVYQLKQKQIAEDQFFVILLKPIQLQIDTIQKQIPEASKILEIVCKQAGEIMKNNEKNKINAGIFEQIEQGINCGTDIQINIQNGIKFYQDLLNIVLNMDTKVKDFCFARGMEKQNLIQILTQYNIPVK